MRRTGADPAAQPVVEEGVPPTMAARRRGRVGRRRDVAVADGEVVETAGPRRRRGAGAAVAGGAGSLLLTLARLVRLVTGVIVALIVAAILLRVLGANQGNSIVSTVDDIGRALVGPFDGIFNLKNAKVEIAVNWGLAALAWAIAGGFIASLLARAGLAGAERGRY